jgi:hypothetical protein
MGGHSGSSPKPEPTKLNDTSQISPLGKQAQAEYEAGLKAQTAADQQDQAGSTTASSSSGTVKPAASTQAASVARTKPSAMQTSAVVTG